MRLSIPVGGVLLLLLSAASPALCYSAAAAGALSQLAVSINQTNDYINHLQGCGYVNTTEAIVANAPVAASGSACPAADSAIAGKLTSTSRAMQSALAGLAASRASTEVGEAQVVADFNAFADSFYALFNAMDLAECTYRLTTASSSFAAQFAIAATPPSLQSGFDSLVAELSGELGTALQIAGPNFKQQTHFGGTSFLATQVGGLQILALAGCDLITAIVTSEGGGSS